MVVTLCSPTVGTSLMHDSVGTPSTSTVQAPQWPSPHAIFVPVSSRSSRSTSASVRPTGTSRWYGSPLTSIDRSIRCHCPDICKVNQPKRRPRQLAELLWVVDLRERAPEVPCADEQRLDTFQLRRRSVALGGGVQRKPEQADGVRLPSPEQRCRHREVLVDPREHQRSG